MMGLRRQSAAEPSRGRAKARASMYAPVDLDLAVEDTKESLDDALKRSRLLTDSSSEWYRALVLYFVKARQRPRRANANASILDTSGASANKKERYLVVIQKKNALTQAFTTIYLAQIVVGADRGPVEVKHPFELNSLKAIDNVDGREQISGGGSPGGAVGVLDSFPGAGAGLSGEDAEGNFEALFVFPQIDVALYFESENARAECIFVVIKVCRYTYNTDVSYDYKLDMESLGYTFVTSGQLQKFPALSRVGVGSSVGDMFAEEELEAEQVLSELGSRLGAGDDVSYLSPTELLSALSKQGDSLQGQIIDFLLKWEEDEELDGTITATTSQSRAQSSDQQETIDVLDALHSVDKDLEGVDAWLGDQIDQLNSVQSRLFLIEAESGSLEASYSNLCNVQRIIDSLITTLHIDDDDEILLRKPMQLINSALSASDLSDTDTVLEPLVTSLQNVHNALLMKGFDEKFDGVTKEEWESLRNMSSIVMQRAKLLELSDTCCGTIAREVNSIFIAILQHKSFKKKDKAGRPSVSIASFDLRSVLQGNIGMRREYSLGNDFTKNQVLAAQKTYHGVMSDFLSILEAVLEFSKYQNVKPQGSGSSAKLNLLSNDREPWNLAILENYCTVNQRLFYGPLIKQLFAYLSTMVINSKQVVNIRTAKKYIMTTKAVGKKSGSGAQEGNNNNDAILERSASDDKDLRYYSLARTSVDFQNLFIMPWEALEMALIVLAPVISREEGFFQSIFNLDQKRMGTDRTYQGEIVTPDCDLHEPLESPEHKKKSAHQLWAHALSKIRIKNSLNSGNNGRHNYLLSTAEDNLNTLFKELPSEISKLVNVTDSTIFKYLGNGSNLFGADSSKIDGAEIDGMETIAMLVVLQNFLVRSGIPYNPPVAHPEDEISGGFEGSFGGVGMDSIHSTQDLEALVESENEGAEYSMYWASLLYRIRSVLISKLKLYLKYNIGVIDALKADPKTAAVLSPMARLPTIIVTILSMTSKLIDEATLPCVDELIFSLSREVLHWTTTVSEQNSKYKDIVLIHNFSYFTATIESFINDKSSWGGSTGVHMTLRNLQPFLVFASDERDAAEERYIRWMIQYEFSALSSIYSRMEGLGERVKMEELALYVRRKDVIVVVNELDAKKMENGISNMRHRMKKHVSNDSEEMSVNGQTLCQRTWEALGDRLRSVLVKLGDAAQASYQITLLVQPEAVKKIFGKI